MSMLLRREPSDFWRRARRDGRRARQPVPPDLPLGAVVRVPERGDVFVRYLAGPPGAPTVLLLHGWMASADLNWIGTFRALAGQYHVLAVDLRGHGRGIRTSEDFTLEDCVEDVAGLMRELRLRQVMVAGYSMGGLVSLLLARQHPELVSSLVLVASGAELARTGLGRGMRAYLHVLNVLARSGMSDRVLRRAGRSGQLWDGILADVAPWLTGELRRLHPADIGSAGRAIAGFDARPWIHELNVPAVSVVTLHDRSVPPDKQRAAAAALGAEIIEIDGGHTVCVTHAEELGAVVREAVDRVAAAARARRLSRPSLPRAALSRTSLSRAAFSRAALPRAIRVKVSRSNGSSESTDDELSHSIAPA